MTTDFSTDATESHFLPPNGGQTVGPLIFPTDVVRLREMADVATRTVATKIRAQGQVIKAYEFALSELHARLRLAAGIVWVLAVLNVATIVLFVMSIGGAK